MFYHVSGNINNYVITRTTTMWIQNVMETNERQKYNTTAGL